MWTRTSDLAAEPPPSVFLVDENRDTREMYALFLEQSGFSVAAITAPPDAFDVVDDLRPNVVVLNFGGPRGRSEEVAFLRELKTRPATSEALRIVLYSARGRLLAEETRSMADLCLMKPVMPDALLSNIRDLMKRALRAREDSLRLHDRAVALARRSASLLGGAQRASAAMSHPVRPCPHCGQTLEWAERRTDDDADHDYYHPCPRGCGVFCYSQSNGWTRFG